MGRVILRIDLWVIVSGLGKELVPKAAHSFVEIKSPIKEFGLEHAKIRVVLYPSLLIGILEERQDIPRSACTIGSCHDRNQETHSEVGHQG